MWLLWALAAARLTNNSARPGDPRAGLFLAALRVYVRLVHRLRVRGGEHIPRPASDGQVGPLIVVANHTAGVDPLLVMAACPFEISWMMGEDMMTGALGFLWKWGGIIGVDRKNPRGDATALRRALAVLEDGGVVGIFPEGHIAPRGEVLPFAPGVGLLVARSGAPVLQAVIEGTPAADSVWGSLFTPSRSRVTFLPLERFEGKAAEAVAKLEDRQKAAMRAR